MESLHLIVGLGNPGGEYSRTRHNAGFMLVEELAVRWRAKWKSPEKRFRSRIAKADFDGRPMLLCQPQTFMNRSGDAVGALARYYDVVAERLLVAVDDADLPLGTLRMRPEGSSGGHHGLESIELHLATRAYPRQRIGIGRQDGQRNIVGHVLGRFSADDARLMQTVLNRAADQVECWLRYGVQRAMNEFNGIVNGPTNE